MPKTLIAFLTCRPSYGLRRRISTPTGRNYLHQRHCDRSTAHPYASLYREEIARLQQLLGRGQHELRHARTHLLRKHTQLARHLDQFRRGKVILQSMNRAIWERERIIEGLRRDLQFEKGGWDGFDRTGTLDVWESMREQGEQIRMLKRERDIHREDLGRLEGELEHLLLGYAGRVLDRSLI